MGEYFLVRRERFIVMLRIRRSYKKVIGITSTAMGLFILAVYVSFATYTKAVETGAVKTADNYEKYYEKESPNQGEKEEDTLLTNTQKEKDNEDLNQDPLEGEQGMDTNYDSITVLVNKEIGLPKDYIPSDLTVPNVLFNYPQIDEKKHLRKEAALALEELFTEAANQGHILYAISGYRSYQRQYEIFTHNVKYQGLEHTTKYSAIPGYSEHQTGLSMDVSTKGMRYRLEASFANTKEGIWLAENSYKFGFTIRYPKDKSHITGYSYEPWHLRYVGKELALELYEGNITLEEYYNFTPKADYTDSLSYDTLIDEYGIEAEDITKPTYVPTPTPTPTPSPTPKEGEEIDEVEKDDKKKGDKKKGDKKKDGDEDETEGLEEKEEAEPTKKPKKDKKPVTPEPTETPTPTPTETEEPEVTEIPVTPEPTTVPTEEATPEPTGISEEE